MEVAEISEAVYVRDELSTHRAGPNHRRCTEALASFRPSYRLLSYAPHAQQTIQ